jgi:predicted nucleic acid-binding protein
MFALVPALYPHGALFTSLVRDQVGDYLRGLEQRRMGRLVLNSTAAADVRTRWSQLQSMYGFRLRALGRGADTFAIALRPQVDPGENQVMALAHCLGCVMIADDAHAHHQANDLGIPNGGVLDLFYCALECRSAIAAASGAADAIAHAALVDLRSVWLRCPTNSVSQIRRRVHYWRSPDPLWQKLSTPLPTRPC